MQLEMNATRWLLLCGAAAPPVVGLFIIVASLVTPGYSQLSDTISQLGAWGRPHPWVMNAGFIVYAMLIIGFAYGLYRRLGRGTGAKAIWFLLAVYCVGIILVAIFQDDLKTPNEVSTLEGTLHSVFAQIAFFAMVIGMMIFARVVYRDPAWRGFTQFTIAVVVLNLVISMPFIFEVSRSIEGALQRSFMGISLVWLEAVSLRALMLPTPDR